ncbi:MAG: hypothetical protein ACREB3_13680 [Burkholderiales bacterium]
MKAATMQTFQRARVALWTRDKIDSLSTLEVRQLRANAERLLETEIAELCKTVLDGRPRGHASVRKARPKGAPRLISRTQALGLRGVSVRSRFWSRGGVRATDGMVVFTLWADDVRSAAGASSYLLWAPNVAGARPWSDKPGGQERLAHCCSALERGEAEGLLVYGVRLEGSLPEDKAQSVEGADPHFVLTLRVEKRAEEYWATWGAKQVA